MKQTYYTIEVYNRRKWSDKYSCTYSTREEAEERARELYNDEVEDGLPLGQNVNKVEPIHTCYRIKETTEEITIHELQDKNEGSGWEENNERQAYYNNK